MFGAVWIGLGFVFLVAVRDLPGRARPRQELLLAVVLGVWASDIAAFTIGAAVRPPPAGRRRSRPRKTVEGFLAGLAAGTATVFFTLYREPHRQPLVDRSTRSSSAAAIALAAPIGDLFESYLKRDMGVKDTGSLLGGHGGMLDRVDALLLAAPAAYFLALAIGRAS